MVYSTWLTMLSCTLSTSFLMYVSMSVYSRSERWRSSSDMDVRSFVALTAYGLAMPNADRGPPSRFGLLSTVSSSELTLSSVVLSVSLLPPSVVTKNWSRTSSCSMSTTALATSTPRSRKHVVTAVSRPGLLRARIETTVYFSFVSLSTSTSTSSSGVGVGSDAPASAEGAALSARFAFVVFAFAVSLSSSPFPFPLVDSSFGCFAPAAAAAAAAAAGSSGSEGEDSESFFASCFFLLSPGVDDDEEDAPCCCCSSSFPPPPAPAPPAFAFVAAHLACCTFFSVPKELCV
mmetsp:Transcript_15868/g.40297  ORF Transcript_15868/g.40297 Transcript_15868/m.40297 type:complete len:290 (+) Transcript_15868:2901-3770(+)